MGGGPAGTSLDRALANVTFRRGQRRETMPIYEYDCPRCGRFDAIQKMSARPLRTHQACGSWVKRVMSAGAFSFKGSGFYATDYKAGGAGKPAACDRPGSSEACATCPASDPKAA